MPTAQPLTSSTLMGKYSVLRTDSKFITQFLAPRQIFFPTEHIEFDFDEQSNGMAPWVRSNAPGIPTRGQGWQTKKFSPAYVKMKDGISTADNQPIWYSGERGPYRMLPEDVKFDMARNMTIVRHSRMKEVREEWMNAQLLREGKFNVVFQGRSGQPEETHVVDYFRDPRLDITPGILWNAVGANPVEDLEKAFIEISDIYEGSVTDVLMGRDVAPFLLQNQAFTNLDNASARILASSFDTSRLSYQKLDSVRELGSHKGINYLSYSGRYHKGDGTQEYLIRPNEVIIKARKEAVPAAMALRGTVRDLATLNKNVDLFQKEWIVEDPSGINLLSQCNMIAATLDVNFAMRLTVL